MTQEDKNILLKDLCARLPYNVVVCCTDSDTDYNCFLTTDILHEIQNGYEYYDYKPYFRPMSSMSEEECITLSKLIPYETDAWKYIKTPIPLYIANIEQFDFFHRRHLDWRGLIPKGLALEAPEEMYKTE